MLADDLIEGEGSIEVGGEVVASPLGRSRAGKGLIDGGFVVGADRVAWSSGITLDSEELSPKLGVLVEIGIDDSLKLGGNLSLLFVEKGELELANGALGSGGRVLVAAVFGAGLDVEGINKGAGCIAELGELGNEIGGTVDSEALELASGELLKGEFELDENPLDGELLNMSKPFAVLPGLLGLAELAGALGNGPETSGIV